jgi:hypothetical protein
MNENFADENPSGCHADWCELVLERLQFDNWDTQDGLLLLADIWPVGVSIDETEVIHRRYGVIEPPVLSEAKLLNQECNVRLYENYEHLRIKASKHFGKIRALWNSGMRTAEHYPPTYFIEWAEQKGYAPCWLSLFKGNEKHDIEPTSCVAPEISEEVLAALFDPVGCEVLNKMFQSKGWDDYANRADRNGLAVAARVGRKKFNPLKAGLWWLQNGSHHGWDMARLYRTLANNLPPRSKDSKHLLTDDIE